MRKLLFFVFLVALFIFGCTSNNSNNTLTATGTCNLGTDCDSEEIRIPLSEVSSTVNMFYFESGNEVVKYFAVLGSDGEVKTAFDACDVCGGYQGYTQIGSDIKCNKCDKSFKIDSLNTQNKGYGCWPSYLPHEVVGEEIIIRKSDLDAGAFRFA